MKTAIIDGDSLLYFCMNAETYEEATTNLRQRIASICDETGATHYVFYLTAPSFRYGIAKTRPYKGNRNGVTKPPIFYALKEYAKQTLGACSVEGLEADDMVAIHQNQHGGVIASPDKDVLGQIAGTHYNYQKAEFVTTSEDDAWRFLWLQTLTGDSTDNIPGIPGVGPKKAEKILDDSRFPSLSANVLFQYTDHYGVNRGVAIFAEMFALVNVIKSVEESPVPVAFSEPIPRQNLGIAPGCADDFQNLESEDFSDF